MQLFVIVAQPETIKYLALEHAWKDMRLHSPHSPAFRIRQWEAFGFQE